VYRYSPKIPTHNLLRGLVRNFVDTTLGGSVSPFVAFLSEDGPISEDDLDMLKRVVRDMENRRRGGRRS
jgi:predicted transcriptional regulator